MAGTLTGKANIQGGYIYGTEYCDLIIGTTNICPNEENNRAEQIFSKHLDIKGNLHIKDSTNKTKLIIDECQFNMHGTVTAETINLTSLTANNITTNELTINTLLQINSAVVATLENNDGKIEIFISEHDFKVMEKNNDIKPKLKEMNIVQSAELSTGEVTLKVNGIKILHKVQRENL